MQPTNDERREAARKLRGLADGHAAVECSAVAKALNLDYEVYGSVLAFSADAVSCVADLIDPSDESWRDGFDDGFTSADDWYAQRTDEELAEHGLKRERTCRMTEVGSDAIAAGWYACSECGLVFPPCNDEITKWALRFCPHCGARIEEVNSDAD